MIRPILNQVLVKPFIGEEITKGGLLIPESSRKDSDKVTIVATGNGSKNRSMKLKVGDIGFRVYQWGTPIEENGELFYLMEDNAIIALQ